MIESGRRAPPTPDYNRLCGELILEAPALAFLYRGMETNSDGILVGEFVVDDFPMITDNQKVYERKLVAHVDLNKGTLIGCGIGDRVLSPADAYVFLVFYLLSSHVVVHSLANWGLNPHASDPYFYAFIHTYIQVSF